MTIENSSIAGDGHRPPQCTGADTSLHDDAELNRLAALSLAVETAVIEQAAGPEAIADDDQSIDSRAGSQTDVLIELAEVANFFHAPDGAGYADLDVEGHRETWGIRSRGFQHWLSRAYYQATRGAPNAEAMQSALSALEARARFDGPERVVHIRVGALGGKLYVDLCDDTWRVVEIDATGWRMIDNPPVRFRRAAGMQSLPGPVPGGSIDALRRFLNLRSLNEFVMTVAWALACLRDRGPYPILVLSGEQGAAKSSFAKVLRSLIDPNAAPLRALPREERDLFIAANNGHVLAFDNVSVLPPWMSDTLCRLATGASFATRRLYSDQDEVLFDAARPVILNGIEDIVNRPDLADRAIFLTLESIPAERRRPENALWQEFEAERPRVLGALLDAVARGVAMLPDTKLGKLPRMADFAIWATACETALWPAGTFCAAYSGNREDAAEDVLGADPIANAVRALMAQRAEWTGTASDLLRALVGPAGPRSPRALSGQLRRVATFLRETGIEVTFAKEGHARTRVIRIARAPEDAGPLPSAPTASSAVLAQPSPPKGFAALRARAVASDADASAMASPDRDRPRQTVAIKR